MHRLTAPVLIAVTLLSSVSASAVTIIPNYSMLGSVYQNSAGQLSNDAGPGEINVTALFKDDVSAATHYWESAVLLPWTTIIAYQLADLTSQAVPATADNRILYQDTNGRPIGSIQRVDDSAVSFFIDPTPASNSEYAIVPKTAALGGGTVNVGRLGNAAVAAAGTPRYDLLSVLIHETEHALGFSALLTRYNDVDVNNTITIPTSITGLPASFDVPVSNSHIDGKAEGGLFNDTSIADPGFIAGQRALLTAVDVDSVCYVEGCTANQINTDPSLAPEPGSLLLTGLSSLFLFGITLRKKQAKA